MTALQAFGVGFLAVMFFGSFILGLYLRRHDRWQREKPPPVKPPRKTLSNTEVAYQAGRMDAQMVSTSDLGYPGLIFSAENSDVLRTVMNEYFAEVERLARGYHGLAMVEGEEAAEAWLRAETGSDKFT